jgi:hypothetical protein
MKLAVLAALAGCGTHAEAPHTSGPPYVAMFGAGRTWTLHAGADVAECRVDTVSRLGDSSLSRVRCAKPHDDLGIAGWWVSSPAGLYHPYTQPESPDELAALSEDDLLLNVHPAERHHQVMLGETHVALDAVPFAQGWCVSTETATGPARRAWMLCLDDRGIVGISDVVDMGSGATSARFGNLPPPEMPGDPP